MKLYTKRINKMERVVQIGMYSYLNESYPHLSKDNKVLYYRILMKRPQFLYAHIEWLYNNPNALLGEFITKLKEWGVNNYINIYRVGLGVSSEKQEDIELYTRLLRLNDEQDEEYGKHKYSTIPTICRSHRDNPPVTQRIRESGIYAYLERYGGMTTGCKLQEYYTMITDPEIFECHCQSLLQTDRKEIYSIFPPYYIDSVLHDI